MAPIILRAHDPDRPARKARSPHVGHRGRWIMRAHSQAAADCVGAHMVRSRCRWRHSLPRRSPAPTAGGIERSAMNLADNLIRTSQAFPDRPAVRLDETVLSYEDLDRGSA